MVVANTTYEPEPPKSSFGFSFNNFSFKGVLDKVLTLEPFLNPADDEYEATAIEQPGQIVGAAGAGANVNCIFKNTGKTAWPTNV